MSEGTEPLAAILREMCDGIHTGRADIIDAVNERLRSYADRIKAAVKREREATQGARNMRDALEYALTASPRPWCLDDSDTIRDANGCVVVSALNPCGRETRRLIVEAVNNEVSWRDGYIKARTERNAFWGQRDRLRDIVRRGVDMCADLLPPESPWLRDAQAALGEGDKARPADMPLGWPATEEEVDGGNAQWCHACVAKCPLAGRDALVFCERFEEGGSR